VAGSHKLQTSLHKSLQPRSSIHSGKASAAAASTDDSNSRTQLVLELQDAAEQTAALAVLKSLYAVKPLPELLSELTHEQRQQAAVLADK
jgi:hypothetical protein